MIVDKKVNIIVSAKTLNYYNSLGYISNVGDIINIDIQDLPMCSHVKIKVKCDVCGNEKFLSNQCYNKNFKKYNFYCCSSKCAQEKIKKTCLEKFGEESYVRTQEYKEKYKNTCLEKYGFDNASKNEKVKQKSKNTCLEKYGFISPTQNELVKEKSKQTCIVNNNTEYSMQNESVKEKSKQTCIENYGVDNPSKSNEIKLKKESNSLKKYNCKNPYQFVSKNHMLEKYNFILNIDYDKKIYHCKCKEGHEYDIPISIFHNRNSTEMEICTICHKIKKSYKEKDLFNFINKNYKNTIIKNDKKTLNGRELDVFLPDIKMAFEFNGVYWHSNLYKKDNYHYDKYLECKSKGIQLIHIWEDEWIYNNKSIKTKIKKLLNNKPISNKKIIEMDLYFYNENYENYEISSITEPIRYNVKRDKRVIFTNDLIPTIYDCGKIKLKRK